MVPALYSGAACRFSRWRLYLALQSQNCRGPVLFLEFFCFSLVGFIVFMSYWGFVASATRGPLRLRIVPFEIGSCLVDACVCANFMFRLFLAAESVALYFYSDAPGYLSLNCAQRFPILINSPFGVLPFSSFVD